MTATAPLAYPATTTPKAEETATAVTADCSAAHRSTHAHPTAPSDINVPATTEPRAPPGPRIVVGCWLGSCTHLLSRTSPDSCPDATHPAAGHAATVVTAPAGERSREVEAGAETVAMCLSTSPLASHSLVAPSR